MKILLCILVLLSLSDAFAENVSVVLKVKFKSGDTNIQPSENYVIENLNSVVSEFPEARIYVLGHTDSLGSDQINRGVSEARAQSIYNKLVEQGANKSKITVKGMGEKAPIADNKKRSGRATNRRVVATFTKLNAEKVAELKNKIADTKGMTVLQKESDLVDAFIEEKEMIANKELQKEKDTIRASQLETAKSGEVKEVSSESEPKSIRYSFATGVYYNVLEAEDRDNNRANAEWVSDLNIPIGGAVQFRVSHFWLGLKLFGHIQDYEIEQSPNYTWDEETPFLVRGSLISDYESSRWGIGFDVDFNEESFIYERSTNVTLDKEMFVGATLRAKYKWLEGPWSSRFGVEVSYPISASSDIKSEGELGYIASLDFRRAEVFGDHGVSGKIYYGFRNFSNQQNDQSEEVLGFMLSFDSAAWL